AAPSPSPSPAPSPVPSPLPSPSPTPLSAVAAAAESTATDSSRTAGHEFPRPDEATITKLKSGGNVHALRHSPTRREQRDTEGEHFEDRAAQRNLSKDGEAQAAGFGKAIATLGIPIGSVLASPMWRCRDTAQIAFGRHETSVDLFRRGAPGRAARISMLS